MKDVIDRQRVFEPSWNGNLSRDEVERIRVTLRYPGFLDLATLERPSVAVITTLMVLMRDGVDGQVVLMTDLAKVTTNTLRTAQWAKDQKIDQAEVPPTGDLLKQVIAFASAYVTLLVTKVENLEGYSAGKDLIEGPSSLSALVFELALELWNSHSLSEQKKTE